MFDKQWFPTLGFYQASKNIVKHRVRVWLSGHAVEAEYPRHGEVSRLRPAQGRAVVRGSGGARTGDRSVVTHRPHSLYSLYSHYSLYRLQLCIYLHVRGPMIFFHFL